VSDNVKVRIGVQGARELEFEVADTAALIADLEAAISDGGMLWVTDAKGERHGLVGEKIVFLEVDKGKDGPGVGFS
jgi:hypothetical protein